MVGNAVVVCSAVEDGVEDSTDVVVEETVTVVDV